MFRTLGELLGTLRRVEARRLDEVDIEHALIIGSWSIPKLPLHRETRLEACMTHIGRTDLRSLMMRGLMPTAKAAMLPAHDGCSKMRLSEQLLGNGRCHHGRG